MPQPLSSEHYMEIRYEAMGSFLNIRGAVADFVKEKEIFRHWRIGENRVDFWNMEDPDEDPEKGYVSFRNCGYQMHNPSTENHFLDRAAKFISALGDMESFNFPRISRLGVRSRFYHSVENMSFGEFCERYSTKFLRDGVPGVFAGSVKDVAVNLDFRDKNVSFNTASGPMKKEQFIQQFSTLAQKEEIAPIGLFFDIDCFETDLGILPTQTIQVDLRALHKQCWQKLNAIEALLEI